MTWMATAERYASAAGSPAERRSRWLRVLLVVAGCAACHVAAAAVRLDGVRMHEAPDATRVVFDTSSRVAFKVFTLANPHRVVIDLEATSAHPNFDPTRVAAGKKRVKRVRASRRGDGYRVVLDVTSKLDPKGFTLQPVAPYGHRLVVDLFTPGAQDAPARTPPKPKPEGARDVVIAIDAGHGGEDPGASGPGRIREKHVVMAIARQMAAQLNRTRGYRAVLVRDGDYYLSLRKRMDVARRERADLFVSIHADAFKSPGVAGASVYTLSDKGASSETARWLAAKENRSDLIGGVGDVTLTDKDNVLARVLLDLSMDANRSASIRAGEAVLGQLGQITKLHKSRVEQAGFVVLKSPDVPSILVETGYISNPDEARRLNTPSHQKKVAQALVRGIRAHVEAAPPPDSLLARASRNSGPDVVEHTIVPGDTLSGIAVRYRTTMAQIKKANKMNSEVIRVGQVLVIPAG